MKRCLTVRHRYSEFVGGAETQLASRDIGVSYVRPFTGQVSPALDLMQERRKPRVLGLSPVKRKT